MLVALVVLVAFIALVLTVVHWRTVREMLLWTNAAITLFTLLIGLLALVVALVVLAYGAIVGDSDSYVFSGALAVVGVVLLWISGILYAIEKWDHEKRIAKFREDCVRQWWAERRDGAKQADVDRVHTPDA